LDVSHLAVRSTLPPAALPAESASSGTAEKRRQQIYVEWTPVDRGTWERLLSPRRASVAGVVRAHLPARLADRLLDLATIPADRSLAELRRDERMRLLEALTHFELPWTSH